MEPPQRDGHWIFRVNTIAMCGASVRGIAYLGALQEYEHFLSQNGIKLNDNVERWVGCSSGAYMSLAMSTRPDLEALKEHLLGVKDLHINFADFMRLVSYHGLMPCEYLRGLIRDLLIWRYGREKILDIRSTAKQQGKRVVNFLTSPYQPAPVPQEIDLTFSELHALTGGVHLIVCITRMNSNGEVRQEMDYLTHPDNSVIDVLATSMSLPPVFMPFYDPEDGSILNDGGILNNILFLSDKYDLDRCLCLRVSNDHSAMFPAPPVTSALRYIVRIFNATTREATMARIEMLPEKTRRRILSINTCDFCTFGFTLCREKRLMLVQRGKSHMQRFLTSRFYRVNKVASTAARFMVLISFFMPLAVSSYFGARSTQDPLELENEPHRGEET